MANSPYYSKAFNSLISINTFNKYIQTFVTPNLGAFISPTDLHLKQFMDLNKPNWSVSKFEKFNNSNLLQQYITIFEVYLQDIISFLFNKYPKTLNIQGVSFEDFSNKISMEDLIAKEIDKKLHNLLYEPYKEVMDYLKNKFKIGVKSYDMISKLSEIKLIRNIHIHGDGKVNSITLKKTSNKNYKLNDYIKITESTLNETLELIIPICSELDNQLIQKFPDIIDKDFDIEFYTELTNQAVEPLISHTTDLLNKIDKEQKDDSLNQNQFSKNTK